MGVEHGDAGHEFDPCVVDVGPQVLCAARGGVDAVDVHPSLVPGLHLHDEAAAGPGDGVDVLEPAGDVDGYPFS